MALNSFQGSADGMARARQYLAGGVSSNFRLGISPTPLIINRAEGPYVIDADGNKLIDYYLGMGPMILGHTPRVVIDAVIEQLQSGLLFAAQSEAEITAARMVCDLVPCAERVRFGSSGSEVIQAAIRLARAATRRQIIIKFEGHYHGWLDNVQWSVVPDATSCGSPHHPCKVAGTLGQDPHSGDNIEVLTWNDLRLLEDRVSRGDVAAVLMEPVMCNTGAILPVTGYLEGVRSACSRSGTLLIFDEVITGFRLAPGGAQQRLGIVPDLATFGKAIASGFPVAALAGSSHLMEMFALGKVMHGGTYNANPVSMAATVATLNELQDGKVHAHIERQGSQLMWGMAEIFERHKISACIQGFPQIFHVAFGVKEPITQFRSMFPIDRARYVMFTTALLERGIRALERGAWFVSSEHDAQIIARTLNAIDDAARTLAREGAGAA